MEEVQEAPAPVVPAGDRKLRACLVTGLVKTEDQWLRDGNENVECFEMARDREVVLSCTSAKFDGLMAVMKPEQSWTAKWQGVSRYVPGCYALRVSGVLPQQYINILEDNGIPYRPLDSDLA
ncbi:hypothetical protein AB1Y20_015070 [Prymnesium parvum]|uniref:Spt4/RpoE2 zinc finger domain-containing protein n=1 Tax=Prymnesium parvum TaxID=97485 RepID=A0AB34JWQ7_PRYPA